MVLDPRSTRLRRRAAAFQAAFASEGFQRDLAELRARCRRASAYRNAARLSDTAFDHALEHHEGWALEPIGNIFA